MEHVGSPGDTVDRWEPQVSRWLRGEQRPEQAETIEALMWFCEIDFAFMARLIGTIIITESGLLETSAGQALLRRTGTR